MEVPLRGERARAKPAHSYGALLGERSRPRGVTASRADQATCALQALRRVRGRRRRLQSQARSSPERPRVPFWPVRRYHVTTFGCQMNAHDSERIKGMLEELGLGESAAQEDADVLVFNTCTIREKPDMKFAAHLAQAAALKQHDPDKVIAVGGCYAEAQRERLFELYPYVDVAF